MIAVWAAFLAFLPSLLTVFTATALTAIACARDKELSFRNLLLANILAGFLAAFLYARITPDSFHRNLDRIAQSDNLADDLLIALPHPAWMVAVGATLAAVTITIIIGCREQPTEND